MPALTRDGVTIDFAEAGSGHPAIVFVHGWCCDRSYWQPQFDRFQRNHRVVAIDLRGHGASDKPDSAYSIAEFADDLAWLCGQLALGKPVIAGHSMGGVIALEVAARFPELPLAVALFDSPICLPRTLLESEQVTGMLLALDSPDYVAIAQGFVASMFRPADNQDRTKQIIASMTGAPQHVMARALKQTLSYDSEAALATCRVPLMFVGAASTPAEMSRLREIMPDAITGQTVGAGHFHQLEVPEQVNAMLERFLTIVARSPVGV